MTPTDQDYTLDLAADLAIQQAAKKGPWRNRKSPQRPLQYVAFSTAGGEPYTTGLLLPEDARAIANAGTNAPAWLRRLVAAEAAILELTDLLLQIKLNLTKFPEVVKACDLAARIRAGREKGAQP